ncbi:MAG: hypothetical protein HUU54_13955 [Ignavibacteriaceae bacterium]|nr:hypothetical protein [Ignavibacteriaceae bacterium]
MKIKILLLAFILSMSLSFFLRADDMENEITAALQNAKKGIMFGLSNLKTKKNKLDNTLIAEDKLIADIKITKEINGVKVESIGYFNSTTVTVVLYRSYESLLRDKYIDRIPESLKED